VPAGKRMHSTITVTRKLDAAFAQAGTALNSNETLKTVSIIFEGGSGDEKTAQKIVLTNGTVASIRYAGGNEVITFVTRPSRLPTPKAARPRRTTGRAPN